jgi:rhomboid protease GluP
VEPMTHPASHNPEWRPLPRALVALVLFMVGVELVLFAGDLGFFGDSFLRQRVYIVGAFWSELFHGVQPVFSLQPVTMFVSHALLHGGILHLGMNMAVLLGLGRLISDRYGERTVLPLFLLSAIAGGVTFALLNVSEIPMVGASGAVFGFLGVWTAWDWHRHRAYGVSTRPVVMRGIALVLINVIFFIGLGGMIAWEAHLGGYAAGLAFGFWLERELAADARRARAEARRARDGLDP